MHLVLVGLEDQPYLVIDAVFELHLVEQGGVHPFTRLSDVRRVDELPFNQFVGNLFGQVGQIFSGDQHARP